MPVPTIIVVWAEKLPRAAWMIALPEALAVARPPGEVIVTAPEGDEVAVHVAVAVTFWVEPSLKFSVAVNCWVKPLATLGIEGVTVRDNGTAGAPVRLVLPCTAPEAAVICVVPLLPVTVARPPDTLTVATAATVEPQVAVLVRS